MKGICLFQIHHRERPVGARPYGGSWRLTPECELFEWALLDANKSGTAEKVTLRLFRKKEAENFFVPPPKRKGSCVSMKNFEKYRPGYYMPPETCMDWAKKDRLTKAPAWCSVDLRDGNQALITPMNLEESWTSTAFC